MNTSYTCPKCNGRAFETSEFRATGGMLTKLFDIQTKRFTTVSPPSSSSTRQPWLAATSTAPS